MGYYLPTITKNNNGTESSVYLLRKDKNKYNTTKIVTFLLLAHNFFSSFIITKFVELKQ